MTTQSFQPQISTADEPPIYFLGLPTIIRATAQTTNDAFGLVEQVMPPGFESPYHTHRLEDEAFYVLDGEMAFVCDGNWTIAGPGAFVVGPRNLPHGFKVRGDHPARMLLLCTPGRFVDFVVEMSEPTPAPPDMARLVALAAKYSIDILGPLPEHPSGLAGSKAQTFASLQEEVDAVRARHIAAVNAGDVEAALEIYAPDAAVMPSGQPILNRALLRAWFTHVFTNFSLQKFEIRPDAAEQHGDTVIEHGKWSATLHPRNGSPSQRVGGTYLSVYGRLADGTVRVTRDIFNGMPG
jgi:ketosteroid isomerase-like protein/quercetin dioxygenase-like cupin family protein